MRALHRLAVIAFFGAVASCDPTPLGGPTGSGSHPMGTSGGNSVAVQDDTYTPLNLTVGVGETITWTWAGNNQHSVTFRSGGPTSPIQSSGTFQTAFSAAGTYTYSCLVHGPTMSGTVTVQ